jgi:hypothetical protein
MAGLCDERGYGAPIIMADLAMRPHTPSRTCTDCMSTRRLYPGDFIFQLASAWARSPGTLRASRAQSQRPERSRGAFRFYWAHALLLCPAIQLPLLFCANDMANSGKGTGLSRPPK